MKTLSRFLLYCVAIAMPALGHAAQSVAPATQFEDPHEWYWLGHWHLWHGGWAYWWLIPLLLVLGGVAMFYLRQLSARHSLKPPSDR